MRRSLPLTCLVLLLISLSSASAQRRVPLPQPPEDRPPIHRPAEEGLPAEPGLPAEGPPERSPAETKAFIEGIYKDEIAPALQAACYSCHGNKKATVGLNLQRLTLDFDNPATAETWQRVYERVRDGEMPPRGAKGFPAPPKPKEPEPMPPPVPSPFPVAPPDPEREGREAVLGSLVKLRSATKKEFDVLEESARRLGHSTPIRAEDSAMLRLQKQARNAAFARAQVNMAQFEFGQLTLDVVLEAVVKLYSTELPLASNHEQRVDVLTRAVAAHRLVEDITYTKVQGYREDESKFFAAKTARLEAQIRLQAELDKRPKQLQ
jgi:hypothetical protein